MTALRIGLVGVGTMGRHHARVLDTLEGAAFVGAAEPDADTPHVLPGRHYPDVAALIRAGLDAAVVAVPTEDHEAITTALAEAGVNVLVEKPVAADVAAAQRMAAAVEVRHLVGAVGHVERYNGALIEMRHRLENRELGQVFSVSTERIGPFPHRVKDVGVVKDLATHDIDLVRWLTGQEFVSLAGFTSHRMERDNEDLLSAAGSLDDGTVVGMQVNWLTPFKRRTVTVLGDRGAFVADLLASDLFFYSNASVDSEWEELARLRGVSEGDVVRFALHKPEPLRLELETFRDAVRGDPNAPIVPLADGIETLQVAESLLTSIEDRQRGTGGP